jgi:hypothetical protein
MNFAELHCLSSPSRHTRLTKTVEVKGASDAQGKLVTSATGEAQLGLQQEGRSSEEWAHMDEIIQLREQLRCMTAEKLRLDALVAEKDAEKEALAAEKDAEIARLKESLTAAAEAHEEGKEL